MNERPAIVKRRPGRPAKARITHPCPACYRPVAKPGYCQSCLGSGGAAKHLAMTRPAGAGDTAPANAESSRGRLDTQPAPAEPPPRRRQRRAPAPRPPAQASAPRRRTTREDRRKPSPRLTPQAKGNRIAPGSGAVSVQHPARDAALTLMDQPGVPKLLHTYAHWRRVKAAIWYLRHRADLPPGFHFWREDASVCGVYDPATFGAEKESPPGP